MDLDALYRPTASLFDTNRTYVPEIYHQEENPEDDRDEALTEADVHAERIVRLQHRPLVGVLFSISGGTDGELFPIYIGRNMIGSDTSCDIRLLEETVSAEHATLLVRRQKSDKGEDSLQITLSEANSGTGLSVNGRKVDFEAQSCTDGDIIGVGLHYTLIISLFNAVDKLAVSSGFKRKTDATVNPEDKKPAQDKSEVTEAMPPDIYKPSKPLETDHYNDKTIILQP